MSVAIGRIIGWIAIAGTILIGVWLAYIVFLTLTMPQPICATDGPTQHQAAEPRRILDSDPGFELRGDCR